MFSFLQDFVNNNLDRTWGSAASEWEIGIIPDGAGSIPRKSPSEK
jgi:hypothetical protein